jgi:hypothetical protein
MGAYHRREKTGGGHKNVNGRWSQWKQVRELTKVLLTGIVFSSKTLEKTLHTFHSFFCTPLLFFRGKRRD